MYIEHVPNRNSPPAILLRESYREGKRVRKRTLANLTKWPTHLVQGLRTLLRGGTAVEDLEEHFEVIRSRPHGHVAAVLGTLRKVGLDRILAPSPCPERERVIAMICARIVHPGSQLATARALAEETLFSSLGTLLGWTSVDEQQLYAALDWLLERQGAMEATLAAKHLREGTLVLYDLTSTYFEGRTCALAHLGYSRDEKKSKLQIVFGLLCDPRGCPVAVEVFEGNTADPNTLGAQIEKLRERFHLVRAVWVADRGMLTEARLREDVRAVQGLEWISALRAPAIRKLVEQQDLQLSLFDQHDMGAITSPDYPDERLIVCRNPRLAEERARKREELLQATEAELENIVQATQRPTRRLQGKDKIGLRLGKVIKRFKVGKHFKLHITEQGFTYQRNDSRIAQEAALDGIYVIRTSVPRTILDDSHTVRAYKQLAVVERAFRSLKTIDLKVRPIYHHLAERVRARVFLCTLAYSVEWHMRQRLAPILFDDDNPVSAQALRTSPVAPAQPSPRARRQAQSKLTDEGMPVHSFQTLLADLATIAKNCVQVTIPLPEAPEIKTFDRITHTTPLQQKALDLLGVSL
jgi:transposase